MLAYFSNLFLKFINVDMTNFSCEFGEEKRREGRLLFLSLLHGWCSRSQWKMIVTRNWCGPQLHCFSSVLRINHYFDIFFFCEKWKVVHMIIVQMILSLKWIYSSALKKIMDKFLSFLVVYITSLRKGSCHNIKIWRLFFLNFYVIFFVNYVS